jgi:GntR family transcriptional repressor for pyruvate dehydrogenase complex
MKRQGIRDLARQVNKKTGQTYTHDAMARGMMERVDVQPIRRAYEQVADQLRAQILAGTLAPGDRLPPEATLANDFGVSRATVREALRSLAAQRLVRTVKGPGGGNFVTLPTVGGISEFVQASLALLSETHTVTLDEFLEARDVLETRAVRLAAERRTDEHIRRLREAIPAEPLKLATHDQFTHNRDFHAEVLSAAGNPLLTIAALPVFSVLSNNLERSKLGTKVHRAINDQHRELAALIEEGDGDAAAESMHEHLEYLRPAYERAWRQATNSRNER